MVILLSNGSTSLPADAALGKAVRSWISPALRAWLAGSRAARTNEDFVVPPIALVDEAEFDRERPRRDVDQQGDVSDGALEDVDLLGFYMPCHPVSGRPAIVLCPEKILAEACSLGAGALPLRQLYPALFAFVAIHELAHFGMCGVSWRPRVGDSIWQHVMEAADRGDTTAVANALTAGRNTTAIDKCGNERGNSLPRWIERTIEESFANAVALSALHADPCLLDAFTHWVERQSPPYKAGLAWQNLTEADLLRTAESWAFIKPLLIHANSTNSAGLALLARDLRNGLPQPATDITTVFPWVG